MRTGDLSTDGERTYHYDADDRLVRVFSSTGTSLLTLRYDAIGRRLRSATSSGSVVYVHDHDQVIAEFSDGQCRAQLVYSDLVDRPFQIATGSQDLYFHTDIIGSTRYLSDENGDIAARYFYDEYGVPTALTSDGGLHNPSRFTGRWLEDTVGLYDYRTRHYDPGSCRFLQRDPIGIGDSTNLYQYAGSNPPTHTDPSGLERICPNGACHTPASFDVPKPDRALFFAPDELSEDQAQLLEAFTGFEPTDFERDLWAGRVAREYKQPTLPMYPLVSVTPLTVWKLGTGTSIVGYRLHYFKGGDFKRRGTVDRSGAVLHSEGPSGVISEGLGPIDYVLGGRGVAKGFVASANRVLGGTSRGCGVRRRRSQTRSPHCDGSVGIQ